jgi:hypothetical protein
LLIPPDLHIELKSDGGAEALDVMMDGQSHRARLKELVHNSGGQQYDPHGNDDTSRQPPAGNSTRGGTASRGRSGGVAGTHGRSALTSLGWSVVFLKLARLSDTLTSYISPTTHRGAANRPLDPAIDPTDSRSKYRFRRGNSQTSQGSHQDNRSRVRGSTTSGRGLGRGGTRQAVRGAIVGTKVQVTATSARLPQARQHAPNSRWAAASLTANPTPKEPAGIAPAPAKRVPPFMQDSPEYNMLLDPAAFLAAIAKTKDREIFNEMIPSEPKPAPASKAAEIVAKPSKNVEKTFNDLVQSTPRPALPPKVAEIVASLSLLTTDTQPTAKVSEARKLAVEKSGPVSKANGMKKMVQKAVKNVEPEGLKSEELMPKDITLAKAIPPKATHQRPKSGKPTEFAKLTPGQEEEQRRDERKLIRRVPKHESIFPPPFSKSAASSDEISEWTDGFPSPGMSNFSGSPEHAPVVALADLIEESNTAETSKLSPAAQEAEAAVVGLGISNMATSVPEPKNNVDEDLLRLRTDEADHRPVGDHRGGTCILRQAQASGAAVDLMDLDFGSISQDSLIPSLPGPELKPETESDTKPVETLTAPLDLPPYVDVGGVRYFREGQRPPAIPPATATGDVATIAQRTAPLATDQVITESGYTIGVPNLDLHNGHLFGDHKFARKTQVNLAKPMIDSERSTPLVAMASRRVRTGSPVRVDQEQMLEVPLGTNTAADPRPHAIGDQNLPGRSQGVKPQDMPPISSIFSSQEGGCNAQGSTHCPQGQTMPVEANPWGTSCTAVSAAPKASNLAESQWGQLTARVVTRSSDSTTEGCPSIPSVDRPSETMPSSQSGESIFCHVQAQNSPRSHVRPSTSEDIVMSSAHQIGRTAKQLSLSVRSTSPEEVNLTGSSQSPLLQENFEERMVRLMNSQGSTGMTKFAGAGTTTESRDSLSSAKHTRGSSRSQSALGKLNTNLGISKWAAEDAVTYSTKQSVKPSSKFQAVGHFRSASRG